MTIRQALTDWAAQCDADGVRRGMPPAAYTSSEMLAQEHQKVFKRSWIVVGHISQFQMPGDYVTAEIVDHPVLVVRGRDQALRAFSNVCPHRSAIIAQGSGTCTMFRCPYHAWTYDLSGKLMGAPHMDKAALRDIRLKELRLEIWQGFVFVNLDDDATPLADDLADLEGRAAPHGMADLKVVRTEDIEIACNWKILVENFCESYHVFCVHKVTLEDTTPTATTEVLPGGRGFNHHTMQSSAPGGLERARAMGLRANGTTPGNLICIYPAMALAMDPGNALWLSVMPTGPHSLRVRVSLALMPDESGTVPENVAAEAWHGCKAFFNEDISVIEGIQKGMRAGTGNRAPLHPWEATNWELSQYVVRMLGISQS
ncbi:MAG: aromatic ring-hydroxylating dioxygenase subunit alpha [Rhodospirillaceae bacterium]|nr:aromatic ring-hydroxylating dioxygenase subunit alpha [Rhodospirillaceae bacterium]